MGLVSGMGCGQIQGKRVGNGEKRTQSNLLEIGTSKTLFPFLGANRMCSIQPVQKPYYLRVPHTDILSV